MKENHSSLFVGVIPPPQTASCNQKPMASHYGVSRGSIHRLAKKEGIELQPTLPKLTGEKEQEALALLKQGFSLRQVAKRLGVNHETLRKFVKRIEDEQE